MTQRTVLSAQALCLLVAISLVGQPTWHDTTPQEQGQTGSNTTPTVELCELTKAPERYVGESVKVRAVLRKEIMKPTRLTSLACSERSLIVLIECEPAEKCPKLREKIERNLRDSKDQVAQEAELIVSGVVKKESNLYYGYRGVLRNYIMIINDVAEVGGSETPRE